VGIITNSPRIAYGFVPKRRIVFRKPSPAQCMRTVPYDSLARGVLGEWTPLRTACSNVCLHFCFPFLVHFIIHFVSVTRNRKKFQSFPLRTEHELVASRKLFFFAAAVNKLPEKFNCDHTFSALSEGISVRHASHRFAYFILQTHFIHLDVRWGGTR
jgi:hypothetical protein